MNILLVILGRQPVKEMSIRDDNLDPEFKMEFLLVGQAIEDMRLDSSVGSMHKSILIHIFQISLCKLRKVLGRYDGMPTML